MRHVRDKLCIALASIALAVGMLLSVSLPAQADTVTKRGAVAAAEQPAPAAPTWSGFYGGVHLGYGVGVNELSIEGTSLVRGLSADGMIGGVHAGFDWQAPNSILVLGARAGYTWSDMEFSALGGAFAVNLTESWWVDGVVGIGAGNVKPYVFAGYTEAKVDTSFGNAPDLRGYRIGGGLEWKLPGAPAFSIGPEYTYTRYDNVDVDCLRIEPEDHRVMLMVNYRFQYGN